MFKSLVLSIILAVCLTVAAGAEEMMPINLMAVEGFNIPDPITLDIEEDMIAYDSAPTSYFPNFTSVGGLFAVRFTPLQPCTLTYIQVVSYSGAGNANIHVWSDNGGIPGTDLIPPFSVNLAGNLTYQQITLPSAIDIGVNDFHVGVEYLQAPPPFITGDGDGVTENRSRIKGPTDPNWSNVSLDLNIRSFVNYYGNDLVAPVINHSQQVLGFSEDPNHPFTAEITDGSGVSSATIHYSLDGTNWQTETMTNTGGDIWEGSIPIQSIGSAVLYYLSAIDGSVNSNQAFDPPTAPGVPYVMNVVEGREISYDDGTPEAWYIVDTSGTENAFAVRMTPDAYPAQVIMARVKVNDTSPFYFTLNSVFAGFPGDTLAGGGPVTTGQQPHGWAIAEWPNGPIVDSGNFFLVFHWLPSTPGDPGVGEDQDNLAYRSYWYSATSSWNMVTDGEWIMRAIITTPTGIKELNGDQVIPAEFQLIGNYPNPFNPATEIKFLAPVSENVSIEIFNISGQLVKTVFNGTVDAGIQSVTWDATDYNGSKVTSGIYYYKLIAGDKVDTRKMVLVK